jgi:hypothetical protein
MPRCSPECSICMTTISSAEKKTLKCKHAFHKECIRKAYEYNEGKGYCPVCRVPFKLKVDESSYRRMEEIRTEIDNDNLQELLSDDERYNRTIDDLCLKFTNLFHETEMLVTNQGDFQLDALRNQLVHLLTSHYR